MTKRIKPIGLDVATSDKITYLNLKDYREVLKKELKDWKKNPWTDKNPNGVFLHSEDVSGNMLRIEALDLIIRDLVGFNTREGAAAMSRSIVELLTKK